MPHLCTDQLDVLLIDETGKNISGTGADTNLIGRVLNPRWDGFLEPASPVIKSIGIHRLSPSSHGNGGGMGLADIVSRKFFESVDLDLTWKHLISANWVNGGKMPCCAGTDAEVYLACTRVAGIRNIDECRAMRIVNTLRVGEAWVSPSLLDELVGRSDIEVHEGELGMFDESGDLVPFHSTELETHLKKTSALLRCQIAEEDARIEQAARQGLPQARAPGTSGGDGSAAPGCLSLPVGSGETPYISLAPGPPWEVSTEGPPLVPGGTDAVFPTRPTRNFMPNTLAPSGASFRERRGGDEAGEAQAVGKAGGRGGADSEAMVKAEGYSLAQRVKSGRLSPEETGAILSAMDPASRGAALAAMEPGEAVAASAAMGARGDFIVLGPNPLSGVQGLYRRSRPINEYRGGASDQLGRSVQGMASFTGARPR